MSKRANIAPLRRFIVAMTELADTRATGPEMMARAEPLLKALIDRDDWLPEPFATPHPDRYCQYLLHCDPAERFSLVSFVWMPGQCTPVHDHRTWGLIGLLRGQERCTEYEHSADGDSLMEMGRHLIGPGDIDSVSPWGRDIHRVENSGDSVAVSIHLYGANIGRQERFIYDAEGRASAFISGYTGNVTPNLWV